MDFFRGLWRKHRRKVIVSAGCLGSGYLLYKLYNRNLSDFELQRVTDETIKSQMRAHFENIQMIVDSTTLPHTVQCLSIRISEEIDVSNVMDRLNRGKGMLSPSEKLHLWDELKLLSFTRMVLSMWSVTMLSLYIRVQVNILGRHLYLDTARALGTSPLLDELDHIDRDDEQKFLSSADFLVINAMPGLVSDMQAAVKEVLKGKQLNDVITAKVLQETVLRILDVFMSSGWVDYLMMPQDTSGSSGETVSKFHQLMVETRQVLTSTDFINIAEVSLKCFTDALVEEVEMQTVAGGLSTGIPLARLLPYIEKSIPLITAEPGTNRFLQLIKDLSEVQLFFTLLYANMQQ